MNQKEQKEKYSAFISDVSEILGLGKPVDILKLCMVTDRFFKPLQNQVKELEEQIEKMKCCSKCKHYSMNYLPYFCIKKQTAPHCTEHCDDWELRE